MTVHVTIELDDAEKTRLEELARHHGLTMTKLMVQSAQRILEEDAAYLAAVQRGIDDIEAGRCSTHEEVMARAAQRREELLARDRRS